jgi:23S rRNA (cytosine1962-C5)-methyltransferase
MSERIPLIVEWPTTWQDYELIDSGHQQRLERFGGITIVRPEPHALWAPKLSQKEWRRADVYFERHKAQGAEGHWRAQHPLKEPWVVRYGKLRFEARLTPFKHTGIFPEQAVHWEWCAGLIQQRRKSVRVLNLFGYTGIATLSAAAAGAKVTHLDASRPAMNWARKNQRLSGLEDKPIRWLIDDAIKFVKREVRRNSKYDAFILDPPAFGRGPKGEIWRFSDSIPELMQYLAQLVSKEPLFVLINAYAIPESATVLHNLLADMMAPHPGQIEAGELALKERDGDRLLSTSIFARWKTVRE